MNDAADDDLVLSAEILSAHAQAISDGDDGYLDPSTGLFVLTADFLTRRGHCCGRGCRHCPYDR